MKFADIFSAKFKINKNVLLKKLWGNNYFDPKTKKWNTTGFNDDGAALDRCFVKFIMTPIVQLTNNIMSENLKVVWETLSKIGIEFKKDQKELRGRDLLREVFKAWLNAAEALLDMIILKLPSPKVAQAYRAAALYEGPIEDPCG